jgi:polar amino acid transport system substrate-binding protein
MRTTPAQLFIAVALLAALALGGCGGNTDTAQRIALTSINVQPTTTTPQQLPSCVMPNVTASLRPPASLPVPGQMPAGSYMAQIQKRGRLIAGVDQNTPLLAYLNPQTGQFEGAEIDLVRQLAKAILGNPNDVDFRALTTAQRFDAVRNGNVDIVVDAATITCARRRQVDFSTVYYNAGQRVLVPSNSPASSIAQLAGKKVCATTTSTTLLNLQKNYPTVKTVGVPQRSDCLVDLQEGTVDAISSDDTILLGLQSQDPYTKVIGPQLTPEPYGMAIAKANPEFVRFVNGVLAQLRADGGWTSIFHHWLGATTPPQPQYAG